MNKLEQLQDWAKRSREIDRLANELRREMEKLLHIDDDAPLFMMDGGVWTFSYGLNPKSWRLSLVGVLTKAEEHNEKDSLQMGESVPPARESQAGTKP